MPDHESVDDALAAAEAELDFVAEALDDIEELAQPAAPEDVEADVHVDVDVGVKEEEPSRRRRPRHRRPRRRAKRSAR